MRDTERGRDKGRRRSRLSVGSLMQDSNPGPQDQDLETDAQPPSHPGAPILDSFKSLECMCVLLLLIAMWRTSSEEKKNGPGFERNSV